MYLFLAFTELRHLMHFRRQSSTFQLLRPKIICTKQAQGKSEFCRQQLPEEARAEKYSASAGLHIAQVSGVSLGSCQLQLEGSLG